MEYSGISLVTGASGFLGSHVVEYLVKKGVRVRAAALPQDDISFFEKLKVPYIASDISKPDTLAPLFDGDVDRVFHLGAICNFSTPYEKLYPINVKGVEEISRLAMEHKVKKFIHVTSTSVYGFYNGKAYTEKDIRHPENDYGRSKRDGEDVLFKRMEQGLPAIIVRPCTVYGPRCTDGAGKVFSRKTSISAIPGTGRQLLSNVRAEDVAAALYYLSGREELTGEIFNICDETHPSLETALTLAAETFGSKVPKLRLPLSIIKMLARMDNMISGFKGKIPELEYEAVKYLYYDYVVDNSKLKQTGFKLKYPDFYESIRQLKSC